MALAACCIPERKLGGRSFFGRSVPVEVLRDPERRRSSEVLVFFQDNNLHTPRGSDGENDDDTDDIQMALTSALSPNADKRNAPSLQNVGSATSSSRGSKTVAPVPSSLRVSGFLVPK